MSTLSPVAFIRHSSKFYGKFEVVRFTQETVVDGLYQRVRKEVIPCHNLATARSYIQGTREYAVAQHQRRNVTRNTEQPSVEVLGFCSPSGQYYAVVEMPEMDVRIDCHNSATLRTWLRDGVTPETLMEALRDESNVRRTGGWNG
jgi:hypothetical protein